MGGRGELLLDDNQMAGQLWGPFFCFLALGLRRLTRILTSVLHEEGKFSAKVR